MKLNLVHTVILSILVAGSLVFSACKTNERVSKDEDKPTITIYLILLNENFTEKYIIKNYSKFQLDKVTRSNRTLNEYTCQVIGVESHQDEFLKAINTDKNILNIRRQDQNHSDRQNTTNDKKVKTSPQIKD